MSAGWSPSAAASARLTSSQEGPAGRPSCVKHPRGHDRGRQAGPAPAAPFGVPEECPQGQKCRCPDGGASVSADPDLPGQEFVDLGDGQCLQTEAGSGDPREEVLGHRGSGTRGPRRKSPVPQHIVGEFSDVFGVGPMGHSRRLQAAQEGKPSAGLAGEPEPREAGRRASSAVWAADWPNDPPRPRSRPS